MAYDVSPHPELKAHTYVVSSQDRGIKSQDIKPRFTLQHQGASAWTTPYNFTLERACRRIKLLSVCRSTDGLLHTPTASGSPTKVRRPIPLESGVGLNNRSRRRIVGSRHVGLQSAPPARRARVQRPRYRRFTQLRSVRIQSRPLVDSYLTTSSQSLLISYDTPAIATQKAQYIAQNNLGGGMWWELDADKPRGQGSLVEAVRAQWGDLEWRENELDYPGSSE